MMQYRGCVICLSLAWMLAGCKENVESSLIDDASPSEMGAYQESDAGISEGVRGSTGPLLDVGKREVDLEKGLSLAIETEDAAIPVDPFAGQIATPDFYTIAQYDIERDPAVDLISTITRAEREQKRILLQVGGDWCHWCGRLAEIMIKRERVRTLLDDNFLIMKVASQSKYAESFLSGYPSINAYPFIYVLSTKGELLHAQDMEMLEQGEGYDEAALVEFLKTWSGPSVASSVDCAG